MPLKLCYGKCGVPGRWAAGISSKEEGAHGVVVNMDEVKLSFEDV